MSRPEWTSHNAPATIAVAIMKPRVVNRGNRIVERSRSCSEAPDRTVDLERYLLLPALPCPLDLQPGYQEEINQLHSIAAALKHNGNSSAVISDHLGMGYFETPLVGEMNHKRIERLRPDGVA